VHRERPQAELRDLGYVIVDNSSTDGTLEIVRTYESQDPCIRVESPGLFVDLVASGNRSLREISLKSKYTKVLHADDWLFAECLERLVELAEQNPTVGVVSAVRLEDTGAVTLTGLSRHQVLTFIRREGRSPFSAFSRLGANRPEHLNPLTKYGPVYLTKADISGWSRSISSPMPASCSGASPSSRTPSSGRTIARPCGGS